MYTFAVRVSSNLLVVMLENFYKQLYHEKSSCDGGTNFEPCSVVQSGVCLWSNIQNMLPPSKCSSDPLNPFLGVCVLCWEDVCV